MRPDWVRAGADSGADAVGDSVSDSEVSDSACRLPWHQRFSFKIAFTLGAVLFAVVLLAALGTYQVLAKREVAQIQARLLTLVTALSETLDVSAIEQNADGTRQRVFSQLKTITETDAEIFSTYVLLPTDKPNILAFYTDFSEGEAAEPGELYDATEVPVMLQGFSHPIVEQQPYQDSFGMSLSAYAPLNRPSGQNIGLIGVDVMVERLQHIKGWLLNMVGWVALGVLVVCSLLTVLIGRWVQKPLTQVVAASARISDGDFSVKANIQRKDEFGWLGDQVDQMAEALKDRELIRDTFGRYVSKKLAGALLESGQVPDLGGEERVVSILFSDLKSYTTLSEFLSPAQMLNLLNDYFGAMNEIVDAHRGCVIEFLGDGMLVVFGAPAYDAEHADQAVRCALAMQTQLHILNEQWVESGLARLWSSHGVEQIEMRIGVHTGPVVAGNVGSHARMKYGVIGDSVNVAARLEGLNQHLSTSILLSEEVKSSLSLALSQELKDCGSHGVKGRNREVHTYTVHADQPVKKIKSSKSQQPLTELC